jgi:putative FmdB family regulatory protein
MPVFEFKCTECGKSFEVFYHKASDADGQRCVHCAGKAIKTVQAFRPKVFKPLTLEHIDVEHGQPMTFNSERDLRAYCKKHGLRSGALL